MSVSLDTFNKENQSIQEMISIAKERIKQMSIEIHSTPTITGTLYFHSFLYNRVDLRNHESGLPISYDQLITKLERFLNRQESINRHVNSIHSLNFLFNLWNYSKNLQLKSYLNQGKQQLGKLQSIIDVLNQETLIHKETIRELNGNLSETQTQLHECIHMYEKEMKEQKDIILKNQSLFNILLKSKLKQDFVIDSR